MQDLQALFCGIWLLFLTISAATLHRLWRIDSHEEARWAQQWLRERRSNLHWGYVIAVNLPVWWFFWFIQYDYAAWLVVINLSIVWLTGKTLRGRHLRRIQDILTGSIGVRARKVSPSG